MTVKRTVRPPATCGLNTGTVTEDRGQFVRFHLTTSLVDIHDMPDR